MFNARYIPPNTNSTDINTHPQTFIDVANAIELSENAVVNVNGKRCVLKTNPETLQLQAYPVRTRSKKMECNICLEFCTSFSIQYKNLIKKKIL